MAQAIAVYHKNKIEFGPAKAANAGGVAVSGLEMAQNSARLSWGRDEVDDKLKGIMKAIFDASKGVRRSCLAWPDYPCSGFHGQGGDAQLAVPVARRPEQPAHVWPACLWAMRQGTVSCSTSRWG